VRLRPVVDADDLESGAVVAHRRTPRAAEQVKETRPDVHGITR